jgi:hypothetical protein
MIKLMMRKSRKKFSPSEWEVRAVLRLCVLYLGICLTAEEKAREILSLVSRKVLRNPYFRGSGPTRGNVRSVFKYLSSAVGF